MTWNYHREYVERTVEELAAEALESEHAQDQRMANTYAALAIAKAVQELTAAVHKDRP